MPFRFTFWKSIPSRSLLELPVMCTKELSTVGKSVSNASGYISRISKSEGLRSAPRPWLSLPANANQTQEFRRGTVTWKHLAHPNVLPLLGITIDHCQLISNWVVGGNLPEYIQKHPDADKLQQVGTFFFFFCQKFQLSNT